MEKVKKIIAEFPHRHSATALTFDTELKRIAAEREESLNETIEKLAGLVGVSTRQIYNYRSGKSEIPAEFIKIFSEQFGSQALGLAWISTFEITSETFEIDEFDLSRLANRVTRETLAVGDKFLAAFDDGKITGFELEELKRGKCAAVASFNRLEEVAEKSYLRGRAA